ncbi:hypothetical protein EMIHUDRAFT_225010 [Emiliania huxleyi CCMP1516]|uniref:Zinc finger PHD-type domain-containing protein n=2 Tax=Emiliania huxleyi TaxID=2903 RepID=A0A0D3KPT5_EMIH1|nr:hypothetical protein EMIHUDRAFT_225010 [Emiliania huxleyi CCMP1516]EOD37770.1 hypothetical protein EMIHUDRAFT_225010 [Emiliania huxleyi CCMP1516]|eukprot:XP_005790199.1 hypothetical protein EMIHUDRAFT_225010 [Emiliania huxleyi CCMP1516]
MMLALGSPSGERARHALRLAGEDPSNLPPLDYGEVDASFKLGELGCWCDTDRHLPTSGVQFEGVWITCDACDRWCHAECAGQESGLYMCPPCLEQGEEEEEHDGKPVHNQGLATSVSIMVKPMGQKGRTLPSQVAGGYTSGRRAGGGAGAQAHFPGDPEGEEAGRVAAIHC